MEDFEELENLEDLEKIHPMMVKNSTEKIKINCWILTKKETINARLHSESGNLDELDELEDLENVEKCMVEFDDRQQPPRRSKFPDE